MKTPSRLRLARRGPVERQTVERVERGGSHAGHRARAGAVAGERVVHPALMTADVDRVSGREHRPCGVPAGILHPVGLQRVPGGVHLPAHDRVARGAGACAAEERPGGADHEVGSARVDVHVAHVRVERRGTRALVAIGLPVRDGGGVGPDVQLHDLVTVEAVDGGEVPDRHDRVAVGRDVHPLDATLAPAVRARERVVHRSVERAGRGVERREVRAGLVVDLRELSADEQPVAVDRHVHHARAGVDVGVPARDELAVRRADLGDPLGRLAVDRREVPSDEDRQAVGCRLDRFHLAVQLRHEAAADRAAGDVEREDVVPRDRGSGGLAHLREAAADVHRPADLGEGLHAVLAPTVQDPGGPVGRVGDQQPVMEDRRIGRSRLHEGHHHHGGYDGYSDGTGGTLHRDTPLSYNGDSTLYPGWPRLVVPRSEGHRRRRSRPLRERPAAPS